MVSQSNKLSADRFSEVTKKRKQIDRRKKARTRSRLVSFSSPAQIWKSKLSWRVALAVFWCILLVQGGILYVTKEGYENDRLLELVETGRSAIVPIIDEGVKGLLASPIKDSDANKLITSTKVSGIAIYSADLSLLKSYGQPVNLAILSHEYLSRTYRSLDKNYYEVIYKPNALRRPYYIVTRLDSSGVAVQVQNYIKQTILIVLLMSAFVTSALMAALGYWLLEPILFLRSMLLKASENPEAPDIIDSPFDPSDEIGGAIEVAQDLIKQNADNITRIKSAAEDQIHKLAYYDTLTGLPNRTLFLQTLNEQARTMNFEGDEGRFAVIAIDLDHFKDVNDTMGHNIGDAILRAVGKRLRASMPQSAIVSRSGEDEFAITMPLTNDIVHAKDIAERIAGVIRSEPFKVFNENFQIRASIGAATFPDDGSDPDQVLKNADIALNRAKEEGRDTIKEYSEDFNRAVQERFQLLRDLRDAMENQQLSLHYQPQLDLKSGKIIGAEALLRWWKEDNSKEGGRYISPADFIPIAEQSGLIVPIGEWVMSTACNDVKKWIGQGIDMRIAVNVSGAQFYQSDIVSFTKKVLESSDLEASRLELEVTESVFMDDIHQTIRTLQDLHELGVELAIDDFGTGYSSLSYLRQFPIDRLKIDQSFIRNALNNPDDAAIARTIVKLGHSLNLNVIAEGVETKEHEKFLIEEECDEVQGFRYSKAIPANEFEKFAAEYSGNLNSFDK